MDIETMKRIEQSIASSDLSIVEEGVRLWSTSADSNLKDFLKILKHLTPKDRTKKSRKYQNDFLQYYTENVHKIDSLVEKTFRGYPHSLFLYNFCLLELCNIFPDNAAFTTIEELNLTSNIPFNLENAKTITSVLFNDCTNWEQLENMELKSIVEVELHNYEKETLPDVLRSMINMKKLSVYSAKITELPMWFGELPLLTHLSISNCRNLSNDDQLAESLLQCTSLTHCHFSSWAWKAHPLVYIAISELENIQVVDISKLKCQENILKYFDVKGICLSLDQWECWHETLLEFSSLEHLEILDGWGSDRQVVLADTLGHLADLSNLRICLDSLYQCYLPSNFFDLFNLNALKLHGTFTNSNLSNLVELSNLRVLDISGSNITAPLQIEKLEKLLVFSAYLDGQYDEEFTLPDGLSQIDGLRYINTQANTLKKFASRHPEFTQGLDTDFSPYGFMYSGESYRVQYQKSFFNAWRFWHYNGR